MRPGEPVALRDDDPEGVADLADRAIDLRVLARHDREHDVVEPLAVELREPDHGRERRPQLVADVGQEPALRLARVLRDPAGLVRLRHRVDEVGRALGDALLQGPVLRLELGVQAGGLDRAREQRRDRVQQRAVAGPEVAARPAVVHDEHAHAPPLGEQRRPQEPARPEHGREPAVALVRVGVRVPEAERPIRPGERGERRRRVVERHTHVRDEQRRARRPARHPAAAQRPGRRVDERHQPTLEAEVPDDLAEPAVHQLVEVVGRAERDPDRVDPGELREPVAEVLREARVVARVVRRRASPLRGARARIGPRGGSAPGPCRERPSDGGTRERGDRRDDLEVGRPERAAGRRGADDADRRVARAQRRRDDAPGASFGGRRPVVRGRVLDELGESRLGDAPGDPVAETGRRGRRARPRRRPRRVPARASRPARAAAGTRASRWAAARAPRSPSRRSTRDRCRRRWPPRGRRSGTARGSARGPRWRGCACPARGRPRTRGPRRRRGPPVRPRRCPASRRRR